MDNFKVENGKGTTDINIAEPETITQKCTKEVNSIMIKYNCKFSVETVHKDGRLLFNSVLIEENIKK